MPNKANDYDFCGWATRYGILCADGRILQHDCFADQNGVTLPLVWGHIHNDPSKVIGKMRLEARKEGMYGYGYLNDNPLAKQTAELIRHGDVDSLSIWANDLVQRGSDVYHGTIREVSVVLAGANRAARIENTMISHGDGFEENPYEADIFSGEDSVGLEYMAHAVKEEEEKKPEPEAKEEPAKKEEPKMADNKDKSVKDVLDTFNEDQKMVLEYLVAKALAEGGKKNAAPEADEADEDDEDEVKGDKKVMKHNVFEEDYTVSEPAAFISHDDMKNIIEEAKNIGSMKKAVERAMNPGGVLEHAVKNADGTTQTYGIANIDRLFPEYQALSNEPTMIKRRTEWVNELMTGVSHRPFTHLKSIYADLTMDEARARGYLTGDEKDPEVFDVLRRETDPQTVYKYQRMNRDDVLDITDFSVVAFIKAEMRVMLDEELARAWLIGDGRPVDAKGKIRPTNLRPMATDDSLYTIKKVATNVANDDEDKSRTTKGLIKQAIIAQEDYMGSGSKIGFIRPRTLTNMLLLEDGFGHSLYTRDTLASKLGVKKLVEVPVMSNFTDANGNQLQLVIVDPHDYSVGADKGGQVQMFDDFDIKFNTEEYLIETRCSSALVVPYSCISVWLAPETEDDDENP